MQSLSLLKFSHLCPWRKYNKNWERHIDIGIEIDKYGIKYFDQIHNILIQIFVSIETRLAAERTGFLFPAAQKV